MVGWFLPTASSALRAKTSGSIGRRFSQPSVPLVRPYFPPLRIGVWIAPGQSTETRTLWRLASMRNVRESPTTP